MTPFDNKTLLMINSIHLVFENLHRSQKWKILCICQLFCHWGKSKSWFFKVWKWIKNLFLVDCLWFGGQHGLHMESTNKRNCTKIAWTFGCCIMYGMPSNREHNCISSLRRWQNDQIMEKWFLNYREISSLILLENYLFLWFPHFASPHKANAPYL